MSTGLRSSVDPPGPDPGLAARFVSALGRLEADGDVEPMVALYAEQCTVANVTNPGGFEGRDGARRFWNSYRASCGDVRSEFRSVVERAGDSGAAAALEWETAATVDGRVVRYGGVTVLEAAGDGITRSCAYFDGAALGRQTIEAARGVGVGDSWTDAAS